ncbi:MAG: aldehyde dehydrogenase family protein, partial [Micrococcales bacterium]|nr:aldehyde dehydrogenase family protein [Micrococcales bacterium]
MASPTINSSPWDNLTALVTTAEARPLRPITSPLDGSLLGQVPLCEPEDVVHAAAKARAAQRVWANRPIGQRCRIINRFRDSLLTNHV